MQETKQLIHHQATEGDTRAVLLWKGQLQSHDA